MAKIFVDIPKKYLRPVDEEAKRQRTTRNELVMRAIRIYFGVGKTIKGGRRERQH